MNAQPQTLLVVDDDIQIRNMLGGICEQAGFDVLYASSAAEAHASADEHREIDLCLCDIGLPDASGLDVARSLIELRRDIAVLIVTGQNDPEQGAEATAFGVYSYIVKPFRANELLLAVKNALRRRQVAIDQRTRHDELEGLVRERTEELRASREEMIRRLAAAIELRDQGTGDHIDRVSSLVEALARHAGLSPARCELIGTASCLHDVGKIGVPDELLGKPGPFTEEERPIMQRHAEIGHAMLDDSQSELVQAAALIALTHHERFDGKGYPHGLVGEEIPLEGRLVAICDVYDALTAKDRPYKAAMPVDRALDILVKEFAQRGKVDSELLDLFIARKVYETIDLTAKPA